MVHHIYRTKAHQQNRFPQIETLKIKDREYIYVELYLK